MEQTPLDLELNNTSNKGPVECLGMTFPNDQARREYFLEKLREKLQDPEFRKIEGFPTGTDEDILALSDPPYYTACPNPFIEDFIKCYGVPYDPDQSYQKNPFATDISEGKNDPIYDAHPYHTKVPPKALIPLILHYTNPGDIVLDAFSGSGMLGVACALCDNPQNCHPEYKVNFGKRYAVLSDISILGTHISNINNRPVITASEFAEESNQIFQKVYSEYSWMYKTNHSDGLNQGEILYCIWSEYYECPNCSNEICAWDVIVDRSTPQLRKTFHCPSCKLLLQKDKLNRVSETFFDSLLGSTSYRNKSRLVKIYYRVGKERFEKSPDKKDLSLIENIEKTELPIGTSIIKINHKNAPWGDFYRAGYHTGITHVHHFFTKRNFIILNALKRAAFNSKNINQMLFVLTGFVDNHSSKRNRYIIDIHHPQGTTCGPLPNSLFIPELQCEVNPFLTWNKTVKKQTKSFLIQRPQSSIISTEASQLNQIPDQSIDYVFIDPPFGNNILYSESSFCWEYFLGIFTNSSNEAIISKHQNKDVFEYRRLIERVLIECYRVLKPGHWMTVEFSNRSNIIWNNLSNSITSAGFVIADVRVFDKKQGTIRQDMGQSINKDLIISAYKPNGGLEQRFLTEAGTSDGVWDFIQTHLKQLPIFVIHDNKIEIINERQSHILFDRMVAFHVKRGVSVPLSASEFYQGLSQRYPEREGMFFLPDQVNEYDKKRITMVGIEQLQIFITDEASAIQWLRQLIKDDPKTFQEIHPLFLREIAGWQKYEKPLELLDILEQNFLRYEGQGEVPSVIYNYLSSNFKELKNLAKNDPLLRTKAKDHWYIPDPNKAADLEKLRERTLLRDFTEYKNSKQRRLKIFRLEAVRAGFKKAWAEKDYVTIIEVGQKIPETVLQEDSKLLMYYDNAKVRVNNNE